MRAVRSTARPDSGMSLIELMIAAMVLAIAVIALLGVITVASTSSSDNRDSSVAMNRARDIMAQIRAWDDSSFQQLEAQFDGRTWRVAGLNKPQTGVPVDWEGGYAEATVVPFGGDPDILEVTVTITWQGIAGERSIELSSLVTER